MQLPLNSVGLKSTDILFGFLSRGTCTDCDLEGKDGARLFDLEF